MKSQSRKDWDIKQETNSFLMKAKTWFSVQDVREIKPPLSLPHLRKLTDNRPLSSNFVRGYALCHYPKNENQDGAVSEATASGRACWLRDERLNNGTASWGPCHRVCSTEDNFDPQAQAAS